MPFLYAMNYYRAEVRANPGHDAQYRAVYEIADARKSIIWRTAYETGYYGQREVK